MGKEMCLDAAMICLFYLMQGISLGSYVCCDYDTPFVR